jgi:hypothetical protein
MFDFLSEFIGSITWRSALIGALIFLGSFALNLAIVSIILVNIPADHFSNSERKKLWSDRHATIRIVGIIGKNLLGVFLVALGIVLSLPGVPGQGLLTVLLGIMLLDFPGRQHLEQKLLRKPAIINSINRLRGRFNKPPLQLDA